MKTNRIISLFASVLIGLAGCGGSSSSEPPDPPPPPPPIGKAEAFQFLNQATFGATEAEADDVIAMRFEAWIDDQIRTPMSFQLPHLQAQPDPPFPGLLHNDRVDIWFRNSVHGEDQLRQRVAFALSEIFVVSQIGALQGRPFAVADFYDLLTRRAFGNFRVLIEEVTLHPAMGVYLSMLGNRAPIPELNIRPDENYARELMQLFSIGLVELNIDGTEVLVDGQNVPTYDQAIIEGFAHVFTGWTWANSPFFGSGRVPASSQYTPMEHWPQFHDTGPKQLLNGVLLPAGQTGEQDLSDALDNIFNHPNVGPFMAIRLIQRLTTSNPSPAYVRRVAETFNDNGNGVRGDLAAVVKAILLDPEARPGSPMEMDGKLKEPLIRLTQLYRAYNATSQSGKFMLFYLDALFGQGPQQSPSVFNFFSPFFAPPGEIRDAGLVAPELEIATEYLNTYYTNWMLWQTFGNNHTNPDLEEDTVYINFQEEMDIAADADALINMVTDKLLGGEISDTLRAETLTLINLFADTDAALRAAVAIYMVTTSPEYAYQR